MSLAKNTKKTLISKHRLHEGDTGSPEVQVAILTSRVKTLASHLKNHTKDMHSRRGLLHMVNKRRRLLYYLMRRDATRHKTLTKELGLDT
ncbi:MAG: 30S ribosomal protein S15 [bacterium]|nr:30S ribosomal protein S15 [bacterium]